MSGLKTFFCSQWSGCNCGCTSDSIEEIFICNTEQEALGLCLLEFTETIASEWTITEVDTTKFGRAGIY